MIHVFFAKIPKIVYYILGIGLFALVFTKIIFPYTAPFVLGAVLASLIDPVVVNAQNRIGLPRGVTVFIILSLLFSTIVVIGVSGLLRAVTELQDLTLSGRGIPLLDFHQFEVWIQSYRTIQEYIPANLFDVVEAQVQDTNRLITDSASSLLSFVINLVKDIPRILIYTIVTFIATFFMSKDKEKIELGLLALLPDDYHKRIRRIRDGILSGAMGYIRAQLIIVTITAIISASSFLLLGTPYVWFLAVLIFILDFIPAIGPSLVFLPWAAWSFINGNFHLAIGFIITYGLIFTTRQVLEPKLIGDRIGVHPLLALFSLFVGVRLFGVLGFVIGPLMVITTKAILFTADEFQTNTNKQ